MKKERQKSWHELITKSSPAGMELEKGKRMVSLKDGDQLQTKYATALLTLTKYQQKWLKKGTIKSTPPTTGE